MEVNNNNGKVDSVGDNGLVQTGILHTVCPVELELIELTVRQPGGGGLCAPNVLQSPHPFLTVALCSIWMPIRR